MNVGAGSPLSSILSRSPAPARGGDPRRQFDGICGKEVSYRRQPRDQRGTTYARQKSPGSSCAIILLSLWWERCLNLDIFALQGNPSSIINTRLQQISTLGMTCQPVNLYSNQQYSPGHHCYWSATAPMSHECPLTSGNRMLIPRHSVLRPRGAPVPIRPFCPNHIVCPYPKSAHLLLTHVPSLLNRYLRPSMAALPATLTLQKLGVARRSH